MAKEYGKLTASQFKGLIEVLPEIRRQGEDLRDQFRSVSKSRLDKLLIGGYSWGAIYELSFQEHVAVAAYGLGMADYVHHLSGLPDPQQRLLDDLVQNDPGNDCVPKVEMQHAIGLAFSIQRTMLSVMLYQRSMSSLLQAARDEGDTDSLFKAIRVDRAIVAAPTVADQIARAELRRDEAFFRHLRSALKGPQKKAWEAYYDLRYSLMVLRELGFDRLSDAELEHLLVDTLKVYSPAPAARKNLRAQYQASRRIKTI